MTTQEGFIVLQVLLSSYQPVFHNIDGIMFFDTRENAQVEIDDCLAGVKEAIAMGDMDEEYTQGDYIIVPATLDGTTVRCIIDGTHYSMDVTDDDFKPDNFEAIKQ